MELEKLYMFNPFTIEHANSEKIAQTYNSLQKELLEEADSGFQIAKNIEIYANMNYLIGEMIARLQQQYDNLKNEICIQENKRMYEARNEWQKISDEKAPAISYFEAIAKESVKDKYEELADLGARLFRFKKAYESIDNKQNALKKKMEAIRYEL